MKGKRGLMIGRIISTFPVLLLIFLILGVYLTLTVYSYVSIRPSVPDVVSSAEVNEDLMLKKINLNGEEMLVFDAVVLYWKEKITVYELGDLLKKMVEDDAITDYCLALAQGNSRSPAGLLGADAVNDFYYKYLGGDIANTGNKPEILLKYEGKGFFKEMNLMIDGKNVYIQYYYGRCLE